MVLVDFWTYSCINCLRSIPYVRAWADTYKGQGLVVIGVHAPEFAFEKDIANVAKAVADLKIGYPVAIDNNYAIWRAFKNEYWPAHYFIDANGKIRHHHFGEGESEQNRLSQVGRVCWTDALVADYPQDRQAARISRGISDCAWCKIASHKTAFARPIMPWAVQATGADHQRAGRIGARKVFARQFARTVD